MLTFLAPLALALTVLILPIIALYLLKLRRQDHLVSSLYLWQRFVRDVEANAPWQKLRRNLLLLLQILFMLALILALSRPASPVEGVAGRTVVLVLDSSASMAATDPGDDRMSRLATAKAGAAELVTTLPDDSRVTVIAAAGGQAEVLASASQDRRRVLDALAGLEQTLLSSDLSPALALAEAIVARQPEAEIVLFSDGAVELPRQLSAPVRFMPVGQAGSNQAISALSVLPAATGQPGLFVQVSNYGDRPAQRRLVIQADGSPFTAFDLELPPAGHIEQFVDTLPESAHTTEARLVPSEDDFLALDDRAWTVLDQSGPSQVTLVTPGNFFLQTALSLLNSPRLASDIDLTLVDPKDWPPENLQISDPSTSLHIFDSFVPDTLPTGNLLFIAPTRSVPGLFELLGPMPHPVPQPPVADHPLIENVELAGTQILTTTVLSPTGRSRVVVAGDTASGELPLLLAGEAGGRRVAVLSFGLQQSDLPLRPAFPILMANLVDYLVPGSRSLLPAQLEPDDALSLSTPPEVTGVTLTRPDGNRAAFEVQAGQVNLPPLGQTGLYALTFEPAGAAEANPDGLTFAVNFFDPQESTITPRPDLELVYRANQETQRPDLPPAYREWWRPLAAGALVLLVAEWLVYRRSRLFKFWARARGWVTRK